MLIGTDTIEKKPAATASSGMNCGTGSGGFKPGNQCQLGGKGGAAGKTARTTRTKPAEPTAKTKSEIAKENYSHVDGPIQRYATNNEANLSSKLKGKHIGGTKPVDVMLMSGKKVIGGVELKTMFSNKASKVTMGKKAVLLKRDWERKNKAPIHTVIFDDHKVYDARGVGKHDESKRKIFYRRGFGSPRTSAMHEVTGGIAELKRLLNTPNEQLPKAAQSKVKKIKRTAVSKSI